MKCFAKLKCHHFPFYVIIEERFLQQQNQCIGTVREASERNPYNNTSAQHFSHLSMKKKNEIQQNICMVMIL